MISDDREFMRVIGQHILSRTVLLGRWRCSARLWDLGVLLPLLESSSKGSTGNRIHERLSIYSPREKQTMRLKISP